MLRSAGALRGQKAANRLRQRPIDKQPLCVSDPRQIDWDVLDKKGRLATEVARAAKVQR